jgi:type I restriction enzyme S subunit
MSRDKKSYGWKKILLGNACSKITKGTTPITIGFEFKSRGVNFIKVESISENGSFIDEYLAHISDKCHNALSRSKIEENDILFSIAGALGRRAIAVKTILPANTNQAVAIIRLNDNNLLDTFFLYHYLGSPQIKQYVEMINVKSAQANLSLENLKCFEIVSPPILEQRKIAKILTTVDNLIEKTETLIAKYQSIKQGMMHDLFTRGVDANGQLRPPVDEAPELYKESELGWIPKEWEETILGRVCTLQRGFDLPMQKRVEGEVPVYGSNGIDGFHNIPILKGPNVITGRSGTIGLVHFEIFDCWPLNTTLYVKNFYNNHPKFIFYLLQFLALERFVAATGVPSLNRNFVHPLNISIPPIREQKKITMILSTLQDYIEKEQKFHSKVKKIKTALMQDLLTGKVRVTPDKPKDTPS